jgi:DNA-binding NarL/FixJ family response regulator
MKTRCVIVKDHVMFVDLLSSMLCLVPGLELVGKAMNAKAGIEVCQKHKPDLLILDLALPDKRGTSVARELLKINPAADILILSGEAGAFVCPPALRKNIKGVVDKTQTFDALRQSLIKLLGTKPIQPKNSRRIAADVNPNTILSPREREVFILMGSGMLSKEIADQLGISINTVGVHRRTIAARLGTIGSALTHTALRHYEAIAANNHNHA